jgi:hypothetical protein
VTGPGESPNARTNNKCLDNIEPDTPEVAYEVAEVAVEATVHDQRAVNDNNKCRKRRLMSRYTTLINKYTLRLQVQRWLNPVNIPRLLNGVGERVQRLKDKAASDNTWQECSADGCPTGRHPSWVVMQYWTTILPRFFGRSVEHFCALRYVSA